VQIAKTITALRALLNQSKKAGFSIVLVPTMGSLHEGHLSLVKSSKMQSNITVVSIFVNPAQFSPSEDIEKYPISLEEDIDLLTKAEADILFLPSKEEIYPLGSSTFVSVENITERFEGAVRPTHFKGVTTVVASLFNIVQPDIAFFGQKDLQQAAIIKQMVRDLHFPIKIVIGEIIREGDGLSMSSRNRYLSAPERIEATILFKTLEYICNNLLSGVAFEEATLRGSNYFNSLKKKAILEYLDIVSPETFQLAKSFKSNEKVGIIIAAKIGTTRLIDNMLIKAK
jgi:pantoate--beta-alanine ligase